MNNIKDKIDINTECSIAITNANTGEYMILLDDGVLYPVTTKIQENGEVYSTISYCGREVECENISMMLAQRPKEKMRYLPDNTIMRREFEAGDRGPIQDGLVTRTAEVTIPQNERAGKGLVDVFVYGHQKMFSLMNSPVVYLPIYNRNNEIERIQAAVQLHQQKSSTDPYSYATGYFTIGGM